MALSQTIATAEQTKPISQFSHFNDISLLTRNPREKPWLFPFCHIFYIATKLQVLQLAWFDPLDASNQMLINLMGSNLWKLVTW